MAKNATGNKGSAGKDAVQEGKQILPASTNEERLSQLTAEPLKKETVPADPDAKPEGAASAAGADSDTDAGNWTMTQSIRGLEVRSSRDGFRRAGFTWTKEPTFIAFEDLEAEEIIALCREPMLTVRQAEIDEDAPIARASK